MAFDPRRWGFPTETTQKAWVKRRPWADGGSQLHNYKMGENIGIDTNPPAWPLNPNNMAGFAVYWYDEDTVKVMTPANIDLYKGFTMNPQYEDGYEQVVEKNAKLMLYVGSEAVQDGDFVMCDNDPQYGNENDVVPQIWDYQFTFIAPTAVTAAINLAAGYSAGDSELVIDTISVAYALRPGMTINIDSNYYLLSKIVYSGAGLDATITLAWPLTAAVADGASITTAHADDAPIYFPENTELYGMLKEIINAVQFDNATPGSLLLPVVAFAADIAADSIAIVPSGGFTHPGGTRGAIGIQLGSALAAGDAINLIGRFYDKVIRQRTVGQAATSGNARTSATVAERIKVELKC